MSDTMLFGVLRMPYELAMADDLSRRQFYDRAQQVADRIEVMEAAAREERAAAIEECARLVESRVTSPVRDWVADEIRALADKEARP